MAKYQMKLLSSLEKVFPDKEPVFRPECGCLTVLKNDVVSFQVAFSGTNEFRETVTVNVSSPIANLIKVREVGLVPVSFPCYPVTDDNYLRTSPGMYPDILKELDDNRVDIVPGQWRSLWIDVATDEDTVPGVYKIVIELLSESGERLCSVETSVTVINAVLPEQTYTYGMVAYRLLSRLLQRRTVIRKALGDNRKLHQNSSQPRYQHDFNPGFHTSA